MKSLFDRPKDLQCGQKCPPTFLICRNHQEFLDFYWSIGNINQFCNDFLIYTIVFVDIDEQDLDNCPNFKPFMQELERMFEPVYIGNLLQEEKDWLIDYYLDNLTTKVDSSKLAVTILEYQDFKRGLYVGKNNEI